MIPVTDQSEPFLSRLVAKEGKELIRVYFRRLVSVFTNDPELDVFQETNDQKVSHVRGSILKERFDFGEQNVNQSTWPAIIWSTTHSAKIPRSV